MMLKQISLITVAAIGIGALFLGTNLPPTFATVPPGCTGDPHSVPGVTGDPHNGFRNPDSGNPHVSFGICPGAK